MSLGSLTDLLNRNGNHISLRRKLEMLLNIASGMRKLHQHRIFHRDIRPDNILVNANYSAKIADMGIARKIDPLYEHSGLGPIRYMAPESFYHIGNAKVDIFSFGLTLNDVFTSKVSSFHRDNSHNIHYIFKSRIFTNLIYGCTAKHPDNRPTASYVENILKDYAYNFGNIVESRYPNYANADTEEKNDAFMEFYEKYGPTSY